MSVCVFCVVLVVSCLRSRFVIEVCVRVLFATLFVFVVLCLFLFGGCLFFVCV